METKKMNDIVYFVKDSPENNELRYSLRSVEKNFPHNKVWFYGGKPNGLRPDKRVQIAQNNSTKWQNVRFMLREACKNDEITEDFWLFNDDFFIMKPVKELPPIYDGDLYKRIIRIEENHGDKPTNYTANLRQTVKELEKRGLDCLNYAVHIPILVNRKKALEVLKEFPNCPMFRSLYGNYCKVGGIDYHDVKIHEIDKGVDSEWGFLSTTDSSFAQGKVGEYIREMFKERSRFEE